MFREAEVYLIEYMMQQRFSFKQIARAVSAILEARQESYNRKPI
jgi:hypothetical protein